MKIYSVMAILLFLADIAFAGAAIPEPQGLKIAGSSTVQPLAEVVGKLYLDKYGEPVRIMGGGSMAGIEHVLSGASDIGLVSRALTGKEKARLDYATIGHDAVVIIVNSKNPISEIKRDSLAALFIGIVRNWKEIGGQDEPVLLISKLPGRSTLEIFEKYTGLRHPSRTDKGIIRLISKNVYEIGSNLESATLVGGLPGAIGYVSMGTALLLIEKGMPLKILRLEGIDGTRKNVISGRYPIRRELNLVFKKNSRKVKRFVDLFLAPEGQRILIDNGFIPVRGENRFAIAGKE